MDSTTLLQNFNNITLCHNNELTLIEKDSQATLRSVTIKNVPKDSFAVKIDDFKVQNVFKGKNGWGYNKHSDYVIITPAILLFIEMKSANHISPDRQKKIITKFNSDTCILDYFDVVFNRMLGKNPFFNKRDTRFIALYCGPEMKSTTSVKPEPPTHTRPDSFARIAVKDNDIINFKRLCIGI